MLLSIVVLHISVSTFGQNYSIVSYKPANVRYSKKITDKNYHLLVATPGVIELTPNLFCDQLEMGNVDWQEYVFWTKEVYGEGSIEHLATLPNPQVWNELDTCLSAFATHYSTHVAYRYFPLVGVSQQQAKEFSKWRTDRVFEGILTKLGKIEWDSILNRDNYFTIERYFKDTSGIYSKGEKVSFYPDYRLPTFDERRQILNYTDSVDKAYFDKCRSKRCKECKPSIPKFYSDIKPCSRDEPTISIYEHFCEAKGNQVTNLRGNVGEWAAEDSISFGGGWIDKREVILQSDTFKVIAPNAWTGFRNVCSWVKWTE